MYKMGLRDKLNMIADNNAYNDDDLSGNIEPDNTIDDRESLSIKSYLKNKGYDINKQPNTGNAPKKTGSFTGLLDEIRLFEEYEDDMDDEDDPYYNSFLSNEFKKLNKKNKKFYKRMKNIGVFTDENDLISTAKNFDNYIDRFFEDEIDGDKSMKNNLISMGRKYARDTEFKESSEVTKAYAESEKRLKAMYDDITLKIDDVNKDIERMRVPGRGGKILADLISAQNALMNTKLSIVKEINSIKKNKFDIQHRIDSKKELENINNTDINTNTIQSMFSAAKGGNLVQSVGGYSSVSGASYSDDDVDYYDDEDIQEKYFNNENTEETDGDKFLKYENDGVEYVLIIDDEGNPQQVLAEDVDGNIIPDYPLPSNIDELSFDIDNHAGVATDNLHRIYKIRTYDD